MGIADATRQSKTLSTRTCLHREKLSLDRETASSVCSVVIKTNAFYFGGAGWGFAASGVVWFKVRNRANSPCASVARSGSAPAYCTAWLMETSASGYFFWWSWASAKWYQTYGSGWPG